MFPNLIFRKKSSGFTLIELLLVIGIIAVAAQFLILGPLGRRGENELQNTGKDIAGLLREAESRSAAQSSSTVWGVHFENSTSTAPFYALFSGGTYASTNRVGYYRLPSSVAYITSTLSSGATAEVTFSQVSGLASSSTTIGIYLLNNPSHTVTITIASSGAVSF